MLPAYTMHRTVSDRGKLLAHIDKFGTRPYCELVSRSAVLCSGLRLRWRAMLRALLLLAAAAGSRLVQVRRFDVKGRVAFYIMYTRALDPQYGVYKGICHSTCCT